LQQGKKKIEEGRSSLEPNIATSLNDRTLFVAGNLDFCMKHGIQHIVGSTGKPTTQGKIERFWQTFELYCPRYNDLDRFREAYNHRPHRSLNFKTPEEIYFN
jgi:hypothetical protein